MILNFFKFLGYIINLINKYCIDIEEYNEIDFIEDFEDNKKENLFSNDDYDDYFLKEL